MISVRSFTKIIIMPVLLFLYFGINLWLPRMGRDALFIVMITLIAVALTSDILNHAYIDHLECSINKEYCLNSTCKLTFKTRFVKQFTWTCHLMKRVDAVDVQVILYYRYRAGYKKFLIDVKADFCAYHVNQVASPILDLVASTYKNYTKNVWRPCPFYPENLAVTNLPLIPSLVKNIFVPAGEYKVVVTVLVGGKNSTLLTSVAIFGNVPAGRTLENDNMG